MINIMKKGGFREIMKEKFTDVRTTAPRKGWKKFLPYMLMLPTIAGVTVFSFYPFLKTVISSFSVTNQFGEWLKWGGTYFWKQLFTSENGLFWTMLSNTMVFAVMNFILTFVTGMILALLCVKRGRFSKLYQTIYALPIAISSVAASVMCKFIFQGNGGLMNVWTGIDIDWLKDERTALLVLSIITSWSHVGTAFLLLLAGFRGVSEDVQEAAIVDGAGAFTRAVKIMIPMASPQIFYVVFTNILTAVKTFTQVKLLTGGGPNDATRTLMFQIYVKGSQLGEYEYACCASIVMFLIIFVITRIQFKFEEKLVHYQ